MLFPNGGTDIYPTRLWAVAAVSGEMIQPATNNIEESVLMDGISSDSETVWRMCVRILDFNLQTHGIRQDW